ncbi:MAG TPA: hypothetical protein VKL19_14560 [Thermoanaerobaculia bacterium]|nr:hypothetical protein [Thermoanaerobaculia bacterium]
MPARRTRNCVMECCAFTINKAELDEARTLPTWHFPSRSYAMHSSLVGGGQRAAGGPPPGFLFSPPAARRPLPAVVGHHTIYSSGMHGANMRALLPLLESRTQGADLYVCGHDHDLELIGDRTGHARPLFLISGAGSGVDVMKPRARRTSRRRCFPNAFRRSWVLWCWISIPKL